MQELLPRSPASVQPQESGLSLFSASSNLSAPGKNNNAHCSTAGCEAWSVFRGSRTVPGLGKHVSTHWTKTLLLKQNPRAKQALSQFASNGGLRSTEFFFCGFGRQFESARTPLPQSHHLLTAPRTHQHTIKPLAKIYVKCFKLFILKNNLNHFNQHRNIYRYVLHLIHGRTKHNQFLSSYISNI